MSVEAIRKKLAERMRNVQEQLDKTYSDMAPPGTPMDIPTVPKGFVNIKEQLLLLKAEATKKEIQLKESLIRLREAQGKAEMEEVIRGKEEDLRGILTEMAEREHDFRALLEKKKEEWSRVRQDLEEKVQKLEYEKAALITEKKEIAVDHSEVRKDFENKIERLRESAAERDRNVSRLETDILQTQAESEKAMLRERLKWEKAQTELLAQKDDEISQLRSQVIEERTHGGKPFEKERLGWEKEKIEFQGTQKNLSEQLQSLRTELEAERGRLKKEIEEREQERQNFYTAMNEEKKEMGQKAHEQEQLVLQLKQTIADLERQYQSLVEKKGNPGDQQKIQELENILAQKDRFLSERDDKLRSLEREREELSTKVVHLIMDAERLERIEKELSNVSEYAHSVARFESRPPPSALPGNPSVPMTPRPPSASSPKPPPPPKEPSFFRRLFRLFAPTAVSVRIKDK